MRHTGRGGLDTDTDLQTTSLGTSKAEISLDPGCLPPVSAALTHTSGEYVYPMRGRLSPSSCDLRQKIPYAKCIAGALSQAGRYHVQ